MIVCGRGRNGSESMDRLHGDGTSALVFDLGHGKAGDGLMQEEGTFQSLRSQT